jgi:hypothetical protein
MSWWQLKQKYGPILAHIFPWAELHYVTVVKWYSIDIPYPEMVVLRPKVHHAHTDEVQVTIWKP